MSDWEDMTTTSPSQYDAVRKLIGVIEEYGYQMEGAVFEERTFTYRPQYEKLKPMQWCALWKTTYGTVGPSWIYDQPAKVFLDGQQEWFFNGKRHRDPKNGPAVLTSDGIKYYFFNGVEVDADAEVDCTFTLAL